MLFFIPIAAMPKDRRATYIHIICANRPEKEEQPEETKLTTPAPSAPRLPTSPPRRSS
jgi:hypothetical protein